MSIYRHRAPRPPEFVCTATERVGAYVHQYHGARRSEYRATASTNDNNMPSVATYSDGTTTTFGHIRFTRYPSCGRMRTKMEQSSLRQLESGDCSRCKPRYLCLG